MDLKRYPMQNMCQIAYRSSETDVKLKVGPPKFEFWAGFRTLTLVILGDSETLPLQMTCQIAHRSAETEVKWKVERPKFEF